jgi:hypothetical protein
LGIDPEDLAAVAAGLKDVRAWLEEGEAGLFSAREEYPLPSFLSVVAFIIAKEGWLSRSAAKDKIEVMPTANLALEYLRDRTGKVAKKYGTLSKETDTHLVELASNALEYASTLVPKNDYEQNLSVITRSARVDAKTAGYAASLIPAYQKHIERIAQAELAKQQPSNHVGKVKERLELELYVFKRFVNDGYSERTNYSFSSTLLLMRDKAGNVFRWSASGIKEDLLEGKTYRLKGTIKEHAEYKGTKQTILTRCTLLSANTATPVTPA